MKRLLVLLSFLTPFIASAQTNFSGWDQFSSNRFGFTLKYPDTWDVNEVSNGEYAFKNPYEKLGEFRIIVEEKFDSISASNDLIRLQEENAGSSLSEVGDHQILIYKTMSVLNGVSVEIHHWVIRSGNTLFHCTYKFDSALRNATNLTDEMKMAYQAVESINFSNE
ncbi:MAG: DUF3805 domain-containing protein [Bacteroidota bacterium]|nr:DUF3805 domain-containing protein [Bacteroidota bacterium]MDX5430533.1 DUF3805 domain-containing protein [Bacteroidota bacterium]MDX5469286.1 DUF3805 domain-containing protein [Bacteroidota bacterium]